MVSYRYFSAFLLLPLLASPVLAQTAPAYSTVEIARGNDSWFPVQARSLNNAGAVVGGYQGDDMFVYSDGVTTTQRNPLGYSVSATGINDAGRVVGRISARERSTGDGGNYAFVRENGRLYRIGGNDSGANDVNQSGQVVGYSNDGNENRRAFLHSNGATQELGTLGGATSEAKALNDNGQVVGTARTADGREHAFLYSAGGMADLGTFGGARSEATGINNAGQVVGNAQTSDGSYHAFLYANGVMTDLNSLIGGTTSYAMRINNAGQILIRGNTQTSGFETDDYLYSNGALYALAGLIDPSLNMYETYATDINDRGQITMNGKFDEVNATNLAIRLDPIPVAAVPEPATYGMLLAGLGLIGCMARRKTRTA